VFSARRLILSVDRRRHYVASLSPPASTGLAFTARTSSQLHPRLSLQGLLIAPRSVVGRGRSAVLVAQASEIKVGPTVTTVSRECVFSANYVQSKMRKTTTRTTSADSIESDPTSIFRERRRDSFIQLIIFSKKFETLLHRSIASPAFLPGFDKGHIRCSFCEHA
jgi:hypothetical protein